MDIIADVYAREVLDSRAAVRIVIVEETITIRGVVPIKLTARATNTDPIVGREAET